MSRSSEISKLYWFTYWKPYYISDTPGVKVSQNKICDHKNRFSRLTGKAFSLFAWELSRDQRGRSRAEKPLYFLSALTLYSGCCFFFSSSPCSCCSSPSLFQHWLHTHTHPHGHTHSAAFMTGGGWAAIVWVHLILHLRYTVYNIVCTQTARCWYTVFS